MNTSNFSYSEEALLLNSLHEVVKVWTSENGNAEFKFKIENGTAELQLAFKLGDPVTPTMLSHNTISSNLSMISIMSNCSPAATAIRDQHDVRKVMLKSENIIF